MNKKVVKLKERREKKITEVKTKRKKRLLIIGFIISTIFAIIYMAFYFEIFNVSEIKVSGNINVSDALIIENSGIERDENLYNLSSVGVKKKISKINWVDTATITKKWPSTVNIDIVERKPLFYIEAGKEKFVIDIKGYVVDNLKNYNYNKRLVRLNIFKTSGIKIGLQLSSKNVKNILKAYMFLSKDIKNNVTNITSRSVDELYFITKGIEIRYGKAEDRRLKNEVIKTILKNKKEEISTIDVRIPDKPVVRLISKQVIE